MQLIDEIERAAKAAMTSVIEDDAEYDDARAAMLLLRANRRWPRIKAALLAGEVMADEFSETHCPCVECLKAREDVVKRFRAATREAK